MSEPASKLKHHYLPEFHALWIRRNHPAMVSVNLTKQCNQHCLYCEIGVNAEAPASSELDLAMGFRILDDMAKHKISKISLCGGEPLLFPGIIALIEYAGKKGIRVSMTSNGMLLHTLNTEELALLKRYHVEINISVDSFDDRIQTLMRGSKTALTNAMKSIRVLKQQQIPFTVLTVISRYNYDTLAHFLGQADREGIPQVLFQPVITASNYPERAVLKQKVDLNVPEEKLKILLEELKKILVFEQHHAVRTNVYRLMPWIEAYLRTVAHPDKGWFFSQVLNRFYCRETDAIVEISYDGGIQPCGLLPARLFLGQHPDRDLVDLWREATAEIKQNLTANRFYPECNACCHHFSRNMLASILRYPLSNRKALLNILPLMVRRFRASLVQ